MLNSSCFFILLVFLQTSFSCICYQRIETSEEYQYMINMVGLANVVIHKAETLVDLNSNSAGKRSSPRNDAKIKEYENEEDDQKKTLLIENKKRYEIEFGLQLIQIYDQIEIEKHLFNNLKENDGKEVAGKKGIYIKFIPQSTCSVVCQEAEYIKELWLVENDYIQERKPILKTSKYNEKDHHNHPHLTKYEESPIYFMKKTYNITVNLGSSTLFDFEKKFDLMDSVVNRGECCQECCELFMKKMKKVLDRQK